MKKILLLPITFLLITSLNVQAEWLPFTLKNNHITIDIEFNGQPAKAILDSGASVNAVSALYVKKYNKGITTSEKINVEGVNSTQKRTLYSNIPLKLFGVEITLNKLVEVNLSGPAILLGAPFFNNFIVQIDYPNSRIQLLPKKSIDLDKFKNVNVKRQRNTLLPAIEVKINNQKVWLTLDTGNSAGLFMNRRYALNKKWISDDTELDKSYIKGVNKTIKTESFNLSSLTIGPYELGHIPVIINAEGERTNIGRRISGSAGIKTGKPTKGLLGYDILKHFVVTIDYSSYKVHIATP
ncbi:MAG: hypothetical protein HOM14_08895 [Gammaproteobacteria bacterium]|nr:hypothetical protein [Gammaproteobacteria bacterium]MBT4078628.1 hypothetical protein [Gammaproteobacteria bacterium]MBT4195838.1 hypothetical protein [Gammaproteobacteria bacterium]MBT4448946.1 hypothetical protein [Gammaproteobacteria bacterium]MBT4861608.1 hypothetical protein [Gammaproteobacteria bacterium]